AAGTRSVGLVIFNSLRPGRHLPPQLSTSAADAASAAAARVAVSRCSTIPRASPDLAADERTERMTLDDSVVGRCRLCGSRARRRFSIAYTVGAAIWRLRADSDGRRRRWTIVSVDSRWRRRRRRQHGGGVHRSGTVTSGDESRLSSIEDLPLPPAAVAPNGRKFFINHNDKTTTWRDPREERLRQLVAAAAARAEPPAARLARGNENRLNDSGTAAARLGERVHTDNRVFYINHNCGAPSGTAVPYSRDYKQKYEYFPRPVVKAPKHMPNHKFDIRVKRTSILEDSFKLHYECYQWRTRANTSTRLITWRFCRSGQDQMAAFMRGFSELIDPRFIQIFDAAELELFAVRTAGHRRQRLEAEHPCSKATNDPTTGDHQLLARV
uniref:WW domain-containing protein n=1 Tax=Macrostomum lignano TaxID=282301 RepID=A0A1I8F5X6_9PLAT